MIFLYAFLIGGAICAVGQLLIDFTKLTPARILVSFVVAGLALTAVGVYAPLVELSGCGATLPITGFGYALAKGTLEAVRQYGLLGALTGGFTSVAGGLGAVVFFALLAALLFKPREKK
ncbi:MAG: stage V sporulation protein AE [Clostridia bacterium]|nr:stage V sporulation protein AE [Clostridia bacterium]